MRGGEFVSIIGTDVAAELEELLTVEAGGQGLFLGNGL